MRKPRKKSKQPILNEGDKSQIRWIVDQYHVARPCVVVMRHIQARIRANGQYPNKAQGHSPFVFVEERRQLIAEALWYARKHHLHNRKIYLMVMGGRI